MFTPSQEEIKIKWMLDFGTRPVKLPLHMYFGLERSKPMKPRKWKYWRISRFTVESRKAASRAAPSGYTFHTSTVGEYVFRKPLPAHDIR